MAKSIVSRALVVSLVLCIASTVAQASGKGGLRIICEGEARNAEVTVNGKPYGSCPADIEVPAGQVDLKITKQFPDGVTRFHQEVFSLGSNSLRRVEVVRHLMRPMVNHSREETAEWIIKKLTAQLIPSGPRPGNNYSFDVALDGDILIISETRRPNDSGIGATTEITRLPLHMIEQVRVGSSSRKSEIIFIVPKGCERCSQITSAQSWQSYDRFYKEIGKYIFDIKNSEPGLNERFNDAFQHLKSFREQPRPKTNEKF